MLSFQVSKHPHNWDQSGVISLSSDSSLHLFPGASCQVVTCHRFTPGPIRPPNPNDVPPHRPQSGQSPRPVVENNVVFCPGNSCCPTRRSAQFTPSLPPNPDCLSSEHIRHLLVHVRVTECDAVVPTRSPRIGAQTRPHGRGIKEQYITQRRDRTIERNIKLTVVLLASRWMLGMSLRSEVGLALCLFLSPWLRDVLYEPVVD